MGGKYEMKFKISYNQIEQAIWLLLNDKYNEEGEWTVTYTICEVYDDYALVRNVADNTYERVYYQKDDEKDEILITKKETCHVVDVTDEEYTTLKAVQAVNNNSFVALDEKLNELDEVKAENETVKADYANAQKTISENEQKIGELE